MSHALVSVERGLCDSERVVLVAVSASARIPALDASRNAERKVK